MDSSATSLTSGLSAVSWSKVSFLEDPVCDGCAAPFEHDQGLGALCAACMARPRVFHRARAACLYDEASRDLVLKLKHGDRPELGGLFAKWLSRAGAELLHEADGIAPVPMHPRRLFARRYNQAAEIARPLARLTRLPYLPDLLERKRSGPGQAGRTAVGRRQSVQGAFTASTAQSRNIVGRCIVLVDDVFTTGATLDACARELVRAGARSVNVLAVARVREASDVSI